MNALPAYPRLSDMTGYLIILEPLVIEPEQMNCDLTVLAARRAGHQTIRARYVDYRLPHTFADAYVGAQGIIDECLKAQTPGEPYRTVIGWVYRYERLSRRPDGRRDRGWSLSRPNEHDYRRAEHFLANRERSR